MGRGWGHPEIPPQNSHVHAYIHVHEVYSTAKKICVILVNPIVHMVWGV